MHALMVAGGGLVALAVFALTAVLSGRAAAAGARLFLPIWLVAALANLYLGTVHGYSVAGGLPFFAIVFGVPGLAAYAMMRWAR